MDIQEILKHIPHRYPFLLVDKIIDIDGDQSAIGIKCVTMNEPQFTGHFPDQPVMPGVLIVEGMAQTAAAMFLAKNADEGSENLVYFLTIDKVKFRKMVGPGDKMEYHIKKIKQRGNMCWFSGEAYVEGKLVTQAEFSAMMTTK